MNVRDLMSAPVTTVPPTASVAEVVRTMLEHDFSGLPVVDDRGAVVGIVTQTDLVAKHARVHVPTYLGILGAVIPFGARHTDEDLRRALAVSAGDLMSPEVVVIGPDFSVDDVATLMVEKHANPVPVLEDGRLVGIVSRADVLRLLLVEEAESDGADQSS